MEQQPQQPQQPQQQVIVINQDHGTNIILRFFWMIFIGWWLSGIFWLVGVILTLLIVTSPLGMVVMQKIGWAFSLYKDVKDPTIVVAGNTTIIIEQQQTSFVIRYLYFIFFGWWIGFIALMVAWILGVIIIGLPVSILIMNRMGKIITLAS